MAELDIGTIYKIKVEIKHTLKFTNTLTVRAFGGTQTLERRPFTCWNNTATYKVDHPSITDH